jgi:putative ABC transport system substrate-binding protein
MPKLSRVAVFWYANDANLVNLNLLRSAAQRVGVDILLMEVRTPDEIERGFARIRKEQVRALIVLAGGLIIPHSRQIAKLAAENKMPSVFAFREFVEAGGLMSYGPDLVSMFRRCATYVDKILRGERAGDLPIEQVSTLEFVINLRTAKALGITIPKELLFRADQVIE